MSRQFFGVERGHDIYAENGDLLVRILTGTAVPSGTGDQADAPIGSLYLRSGTGELYQKIANGAAPADWELNGAATATIGNWRPENVRLVTSDTQGAGVRDVVANPFSDDDAPFTPVGFYTVGDYIISGSQSTSVLLEITNVSGDDVTFAVAGTALEDNDTFLTKLYLPDSPNSQEVQAIVVHNAASGTMVKVGDVNWDLATGINLSGAYGAFNGTVTSGDSVEVGIEKLDGNQQDLQTLQGVAQGSTTMGTYAGSTVQDNGTQKQNIQDLETAYEETDANVDDLITLSGMPENATDNGTFTGSVIADNSTTKSALQQLESKDESQDGIISEIDTNVDDLITLSGMPENSTDNGTFTGDLFADSQDTKSLLQRIEDLLEEVKVIEVASVTTATPIDQIPVASASACKWLVEAFEEATPANKQALEVYALNNGSVADDTSYAKLKVGANFNLSVTVDISGGNMRLVVSSSTAGVTVRVRRIQVTNI